MSVHAATDAPGWRGADSVCYAYTGAGARCQRGGDAVPPAGAAECVLLRKARNIRCWWRPWQCVEWGARVARQGTQLLSAWANAAAKNSNLLLFGPFRRRWEVRTCLSALLGDQWTPKNCLGPVPITLISHSGVTW